MKIKLILLLLVALCGLTLFGKQTAYTAQDARHSRKRIHRVRRPVHSRLTVFTQAALPAFSDTRRLALLQYFQACNCPAAHWVNTFIQEADHQGLDWRLVASITMIESTGGKHYKNRNVLGWKSASARFRSERVGIQYVSARLGRSPLYRGKSMMQVLKTYNSQRRTYAAMVTGVMQRLGAIESGLRVQQASLASNTLPPFFPQWRSVPTEPVLSN